MSHDASRLIYIFSSRLTVTTEKERRLKKSSRFSREKFNELFLSLVSD